MAPKRFPAVAKNASRGEIRPYMPRYSRIVSPPNRWGSFELRLGMDVAPEYRYIYGYIWLVQRLPTDRRSANTNTDSLCYVFAKIVRFDTMGPRVPSRRRAFPVVLSYLDNYSDREYGIVFTVSTRDLVGGFATKPPSNAHTGTALQFW